MTRDDGSRREPRIVLVQASTGMRGPQRTAVEFATWLAGHRDVVLSAPDGWVLKQARREVPGIRTLVLPGGRVASRSGGVRALAAEVRDRPVIFHANGLTALNLVAPIALRRRAPVLVHFHAFELSARQHMVAGGWLKLGLQARFHAVSDFARGLLEATSLRAAVGPVLPNPFDAADYAVEQAKEDAKEAEGVGTPFRVGFVGGSDPRKGLRRLIEVAGRCRDLNLEWVIFGVTSDRYDAYVEACKADADRLGVADRLTWMGAPANPRKIYGVVDAVVIASELESFCRVAVEAMMARLPVVATRIPGLSEIVWDGVTGLLFDPNDPAGGADAVRRIVQEDDLRERLARDGLAAGMRFDVHAVGPRLERCYEDLLRTPRSRSDTISERVA